MSHADTCNDLDLQHALEAGYYNIPQSSRDECVAALKDAQSNAASGKSLKARRTREYILFTGASCGCIQMVRYLLAAGVSADPAQAPALQGTFPLYEAAVGGHLEMVRNLVEGGANPNRTLEGRPKYPMYKKGYTSLIAAAQEGHFEICTRTHRSWRRFGSCG